MSGIYRIKPSVYIISSAGVVGHEESKGPLGHCFDIANGGDDTFGCDTWEKAESELLRLCIGKALSKAHLNEGELDMVFSGDLLNQCQSSTFAISEMSAPFLGLYGACSTAAEGLLLGAMLSSAYGLRVLTAASSHNASAERQFRSPLEYGGQRPPTAQWTVTGGGAFILSPKKEDAAACRLSEHTHYAVIDRVCPGRVIDAGINDANNMGAAMAPAAADTVERYLSCGGEPAPVLLTGDLGYEGGELFKELLLCRGFDVYSSFCDCGLMIYDRELQDKHSGGSGCGCSACVLACKVLEDIRRGLVSEVLFVGTGALMNTMSIQQGMTIPAVAHLVRIRGEGIGEGEGDEK